MTPQTPIDAERRSASVRTALVLASIAVVFFVGVIASRYLGTPLTSLGVIGIVGLLFVVVAIGRHLRK